jgi:hypothetical protein
VFFLPEIHSNLSQVETRRIEHSFSCLRNWLNRKYLQKDLHLNFLAGSTIFPSCTSVDSVAVVKAEHIVLLKGEQIARGVICVSKYIRRECTERVILLEYKSEFGATSTGYFTKSEVRRVPRQSFLPRKEY